MLTLSVMAQSKSKRRKVKRIGRGGKPPSQIAQGDHRIHTHIDSTVTSSYILPIGSIYV